MRWAVRCVYAVRSVGRTHLKRLHYTQGTNGSVSAPARVAKLHYLSGCERWEAACFLRPRRLTGRPQMCEQCSCPLPLSVWHTSVTFEAFILMIVRNAQRHD